MAVRQRVKAVGFSRRGCLTSALVLTFLSGFGRACAQEQLLWMSPTDTAGWTLTGDPTGNPGSGVGTPSRELAGSVTGVVLDGAEGAIPGATVILLPVDGRPAIRAESDNEGQFAIPNLQPGIYRLRVERDGFVPYTAEAVLKPGQRLDAGDILLGAAASDSVEVHASVHEVAEAQVALEEQQRVLGVFPNFYASYAPDAEPLTAGEKYRLAWRFSMDPAAFAMAGAVAAVEQPNSFRGYGPGMSGYGKRFGAAYADGFVSTAVGQAVLPVLFHQDPRYFVKGSGTVASRAAYAVAASTVLCRGDNRRWQLNYSNLLGNFAGAGASNLYYPQGSRRGIAAVAQVGLTSTALGAVGGLFQEFLLHRMTPRVPEYSSMH